MSGSIAALARESVRSASDHRRAQSRFVVGASIAMFAIVLMGFARTFYLRELFDLPQIPSYLYAHGVVLTSWYAWFIVQASLVTVKRTDLHRRLGVVGTALAVAVVVMSGLTSLRFGPRLAAQGVDIEARLHFLSEVVWSNIDALVCFASFLVVAIAMRYRPQVHKRMMFLASLSMLPPAVSRVIDWPIWGLGNNALLPVFAFLVLCVVALAVHDLRVGRSVHPATLIGGLALISSFALSVFLLPTTVFGQSTVRGLYELM